MATDRLVDWFEAARVCGKHTIEKKPGKSASEEEKLEYSRANKRFQKAIERGKIPRADRGAGAKGAQWWLRKLVAWFGDNPAEVNRSRGRPKKKPDSRGKRESGRNQKPHANEGKASATVPRRNRPVKDEHGQVRHVS